MMFMTAITILFTFATIFNKASSNNSKSKDPFVALGIPDLNPTKVLADIEKNEHSKVEKDENIPKLKKIEDLPKFLSKNKLNEEEGIKILSRFLIQDDFQLKKYGVIYDQTGFDELSKDERIAAPGTEERLIQRSKSAANIWLKEKYSNLDYEAYGAENLMEEIIPNWRVFKVVMIGKQGESIFVRVCLPLDESECALCTDKNDKCDYRAKYVEQEKKKNEDYIQKIRNNNFFKKKQPNNGMVKLLPGEKMYVRDNHKTMILDSHNINTQSNPNFLQNNNSKFINPPNSVNLNPLNGIQNVAGPSQVGPYGYQEPNMLTNQMINNFGINQSTSNLQHQQGEINNSFQFRQKNQETKNMDGNFQKQFLDLQNQMSRIQEELKKKDLIIAQQIQKINQLNYSQTNFQQPNFLNSQPTQPNSLQTPFLRNYLNTPTGFGNLGGQQVQNDQLNAYAYQTGTGMAQNNQMNTFPIFNPSQGFLSASTQMH